jgi:hypothetical protein
MAYRREKSNLLELFLCVSVAFVTDQPYSLVGRDGITDFEHDIRIDSCDVRTKEISFVYRFANITNYEFSTDAQIFPTPYRGSLGGIYGGDRGRYCWWDTGRD